MANALAASPQACVLARVETPTAGTYALCTTKRIVTPGVRTSARRFSGDLRVRG